MNDWDYDDIVEFWEQYPNIKTIVIEDDKPHKDDFQMRTSFEDRKELRALAIEAAKEPPEYKEGAVSDFIDKLGRFKLAEDLMLDFGDAMNLINHLLDVLENMKQHEVEDVTKVTERSVSDESMIRYCIDKIEKFKNKNTD